MKARLLMILVLSFFVVTAFACGQKEEPAEEPESAAVIEEETVEMETEGGEPEAVVEEDVMEMEGSGHKDMEGSETKEEVEPVMEMEGSGEKGSAEEGYGSMPEEEESETE
jgi:hypothetical protein